MKKVEKLIVLVLTFVVFSAISVFGGNFSGQNESSNGRFEAYLKNIYQQMNLSSKGLDFDVFKKAATGYYILKGQGKVHNDKISIVDFDKPSTDKRLWVIDWSDKSLVYNTLVAHGRNSGENVALNFSNTNESNMSSLGFYVTANTYNGKHGLSLVLKGQDEGFNTNAEQRCIVMHGADYVSDSFIKCNGRLGRSHGCPAIPNELKNEIIAKVQEGSVLYINKNNQRYDSKYLNAGQATQNWAISLKN